MAPEWELIRLRPLFIGGQTPAHVTETRADSVLSGDYLARKRPTLKSSHGENAT